MGTRPAREKRPVPSRSARACLMSLLLGALFRQLKLWSFIIYWSQELTTMRHKNITYPKKFYPNYFQGELKGKLNGTNQAEFAVFRRFSLIFADFRFPWELQHFGGADFRRKPQETADFRRKPQETADFRRNPFVPFSLSLLIPPYIFEITVTRSELFRINFGKLPDTYCIYVSCETLPA